MPQAQNYAELLARYQRMRAACSRLNNDLLPEYLSRKAMMRAAKRLGFWHNETLVMDQDSERAVLMDYALHDCLLDGVSTVDLFAEAEPPVPGSDEETVLAAKQRAFYGVLKIKEVVPGVGVHVSEVLREQSYFLVDVSLGSTAVPGMMMATRIEPFDGFVMTGGAMLPVDGATLLAIAKHLDVQGFTSETLREMDRRRNAELSGPIIRMCLDAGASEHVKYGSPPGPRLARESLPPSSRSGRKPGPNAPCSCGSGRKYKKCCGRR